jgi:aspartyl-tRNA(Asn)/glutamyl-tRNA(Gln) amidotransferase subunit B
MKIGLEVHVALPTDSKLFCSCKAYSEEPNSSICPICMGLPGSKPMLNEKALMLGVSIAKALGCKVPEKISFSRKVYFYPDLPKSYQITQVDAPVGHSGTLEADGVSIGIRRIQLEEDPAKIIREEEYTLLDFNRSGVPLVEIVTEPDIKSEAILRAFLTELKSILYYLGVDINKEFKADLNISVAEQRVEIKNITGTKNIIDAAKYEIERQNKLVSANQKVPSETRSYNEAKMITVPSREKESDEEYGFIYDPDLSEYSTASIKAKKAVFASRIAKEYASKYKANAQTLAELVLFNRDALEMIERWKEKYEMKALIGSIELLEKYGIMDINERAMARLLDMVSKGSYPDKETLMKIYGGEEVEAKQIDIKLIDKEISEYIKRNPRIVEEYRKNPKAINFMVGEITKKYKVHPRIISERLNLIFAGK